MLFFYFFDFIFAPSFYDAFWERKNINTAQTLLYKTKFIRSICTDGIPRFIFIFISWWIVFFSSFFVVHVFLPRISLNASVSHFSFDFAKHKLKRISFLLTTCTQYTLTGIRVNCVFLWNFLKWKKSSNFFNCIKIALKIFFSRGFPTQKYSKRRY